MTQSWADYRQEVFGDAYLVWHDGADFGEIARRFEQDPGTTTAMLTAGLVENDELAAQAIREVRLSESQRAGFTTLLRSVEAGAGAGLKVQAAASLFALTGSQEWAASILDVLVSPAFWGVKIDAAMRLAAFAPTRVLIDGVAGAIGDDGSDYLVRYHCANTLLRWSGSTADVSTDQELFAMLVDDAGATSYAAAAQRLAGRISLPEAGRGAPCDPGA